MYLLLVSMLRQISFCLYLIIHPPLSPASRFLQSSNYLFLFFLPGPESIRTAVRNVHIMNRLIRHLRPSFPWNLKWLLSFSYTKTIQKYFKVITTCAKNTCGLYHGETLFYTRITTVHKNIPLWNSNNTNFYWSKVGKIKVVKIASRWLNNVHYTW